VDPAAVEAMAEVGIDISDQWPKVLTTDEIEARIRGLLAELDVPVR
jgi:protein-tyrosine-phosphatase